MQNFWKFNKDKIILLLIILFGIILRLYGLNWDQGFHLHPDERAIVMFTTPLKLPNSLNEFLSPQSPWNPHFFAYGNLPLYLLKIVGNIAGAFNPLYMYYEKINLVGRFLSASFDIGILLVVFLLGKKLFNIGSALLGAFFYAISVIPIQLSHFYAVDTMLTFFILITLYECILLYEKPTILKSVLVGLFFGLSLATKISGLALLSAIGTVFVVDFLLIFFKNPHRPQIWFPHIPRFLRRLIVDGLIISAVTIVTFMVSEPYAIIDFKSFWQDNMQQAQMTRDAFTFPYTLQYVGIVTYFYELKNVFLWGMGPILAIISFAGIFYTLFFIIKKKKEKKWAQELILMVFFLSYFIIVGKFAVGWIRYMLPLYPLLCLFGSILIYKLANYLKCKFKSTFMIKFVYLIFFLSLFIWPFSFMHIYTQPNTRILASEWIYQNIPTGATIAIEHWDDSLPIGGNFAYKTLVLSIYGMSDPFTENEIYQKINESNYIIIASNRLYVPLQRIAQNCKNWNISPERCPQNANTYYQKLFNGDLGFKKVAEFKNSPMIPFLNISINDQNADESFTVYDHPKIMIFKKTL
jgi:hypothetical protein